MRLPILVTRPSPEGEKTCQELRARGVNALHCPLTKIVDQSPIVPLPAQAAALAFTSAHGVRAFARQYPERDLPVYAVGQKTAEIAQALGFKVAAIAQGDSASLAQVIIKQPPRGLLLHIRGRHAAGDLRTPLLAAKINMAAAIIYEAEAIPTLPRPALEVIAQGNFGVVLFSPRAVELFQAQLDAANMSLQTAKSEVFCLSEAIAERARRLSFRHIHAASAPDHTAFVDMLVAAIS